MAALTMEPVPTNPWYNVTNVQCTVREQSEPDPVFPVQITGAGDSPFNMQRDQPVNVDFSWSQTGFFSGVNLSTAIQFEVKFLFEAWGSPEVSSALDLSATIPYQTGNNFNYNPVSAPSSRITIPPNTLPVGVYSCTAIFQVGIIGTAQKYFAGYVQFPAFNVYRATV